MTSKGVAGVALLFTGLAVGWAQDAAKPVANANPQAATSAPQNPHPFKISDEDAARKNPLRFTDVSVARGKKVYASQCAMCHGDNADGKGDLAVDMGANPPDFTKPETLKQRTDGELFAIIGKGNTTMPSQAGRMSDYYKWCLVNFLRSLSGATPVKATPDEINADENKIILAEPPPAKPHS
ncbi:MAG TPA: cytochrome c [Terriglobia bacterium]|nr:cytochrome c [Terriglobia bacterium]